MAEFKESDDGFLIPNLDESFDRAAAYIMRNCMALYEGAPRELRSLLENVAIAQQNNSAGLRPEESFVKDAERYRKLRDGHDDQQPVVTEAKFDSWGNWTDVPLFGEELDAAVDRMICVPQPQITKETP